MTTAKTPRPRRLAGHRPAALSTSGRPRQVAGRVADGRRVAERSSATSMPLRAPSTPTQVATGVALADPADAVAGSGRRRVGRLSMVLMGVAAILAVVVGLLGWDLMRMDGREGARQAAQVVAVDSMEAILSYDHADYDKGVAAARSLMTDDFAEEYTRTIDDVRETVMETRSAVKADVVASSVVSAEPDRVRTLLFVNQTTTGEQVEEPRVDLNRVVVTLVRGDDDAWLVSDIDAL